MRGSSLLAAAVPVLVVLTLGATAATAAASPTSRSASASLCSVSRTVAAQLGHATALNETATPAGLKRVYGALESAKPKLIGATPGRLKADMRNIFSFVDLVTADLKKVNWQIAKMTPYLPALIAKGQAVNPSLTRVKAYYRTTCHFKV